VRPQAKTPTPTWVLRVALQSSCSVQDQFPVISKVRALRQGKGRAVCPAEQSRVLGRGQRGQYEIVLQWFRTEAKIFLQALRHLTTRKGTQWHTPTTKIQDKGCNECCKIAKWILIEGTQPRVKTFARATVRTLIITKIYGEVAMDSFSVLYVEYVIY
jgi:hypothetical protein